MYTYIHICEHCVYCMISLCVYVYICVMHGATPTVSIPWLSLSTTYGEGLPSGSFLMSICMYIYIYTYMYIYICMSIYIYIH